MTRREHRAGAHGLVWTAILAVSVLAWGPPAAALDPTDMVLTKHNLSVTGPGPIRAVSESRICIFCHTPHNATPLSPLWNKELEPRTYTVYDSPTLRAGPLPQPSGATKLCLSCHDGTIAMGTVVNPAAGIPMDHDTLGIASLSNFGLDLSGHHPVSFAYHQALPNPDLAASPPTDLVYGGMDEIHCTTCHDPHNDTYGKFLLKDNRYSALCTSCHQIAGWSNSAHATSSASVAGILPRPPKTWPLYTQLNEWGCEVCHTPHFAPTAEALLNFTDVPPAYSCTTAGCHGTGDPPFHTTAGGPTAALQRSIGGRRAQGPTDIAQQTRKASAHRDVAGTLGVSARGAARSGIRSAGCPDCHNPHQTTRAPADPPYASGLLQGVAGVDRYGAEVNRATYEYEVCFKCHSDNTPDFNYVPRVIDVTNTRLAFDPSNSSYHPVISSGRNLNVPSIPSSFEPDMTASTMIYCSSCHADDEGGSNGPHGSQFRPLLRERYETADYTPESFENYALCYRCHDRNSILRDVSFQPRFQRAGSGGGHSGHLAAGIPCSACHDPHGVNDTAGGTGMIRESFTHLINFDTRIVSPAPGAVHPAFRDTGTFSGSCALCCHGVLHDDGAAACGTSPSARLAIGTTAPAPSAANPAAGPSRGTGVDECSYTRVVCGVYP